MKGCGVPISLEKSESLILLRLRDSIDISSASDLKIQLLDALSCGQEVNVCLADLTALDVTVVQLLVAAEGMADREGVGFSLSGPVHEQVRATLADAGLEGLLMGMVAIA